jgi:hypothetical protein
MNQQVTNAGFAQICTGAFTDQITVYFSDPNIVNAQLRVFNIVGQLITEQPFYGGGAQSIATQQWPRGPDLRYSLVDMSANNGAGKVVEQKKVIINQRLDYGKIRACRHANGRDWWILVNKFVDNAYYRLLLDPQGLQLDGLQEIGTISELGLGQAVFSPDGNWYARINPIKYAEPYYLDIFRFDRCSGMLYDPVQYLIDFANTIAGLAISQDSRYLYEILSIAVLPSPTGTRWAYFYHHQQWYKSYAHH